MQALHFISFAFESPGEMYYKMESLERFERVGVTRVVTDQIAGAVLRGRAVV